MSMDVDFTGHWDPAVEACDTRVASSLRLPALISTDTKPVFGFVDVARLRRDWRREKER